jgi:TonB family protein
MTVMRVSLRIVPVAAALMVSVAVHGFEAHQTKDAADAAAVTPGSVALLANQLDAAALEQLRAALVHQDATVRAVAARVAGVARAVGLLTDLRGALARELDQNAAAELLRALLFFDDPAARESAEGHLARARVPAVRVYVEWLARTGPENLAERVEIALRSLSPADMSGLSSAMRTAILRNPASRERLFRVWLRVADGGSWRSVLDTAGGEAPDTEATVLVEALRSDDPSKRQETVWAIVDRLARRLPVAAAALDAALPLESASPSQAGAPIAWENFGRELVARRHRHESTPDRAEFVKMQAPQHRMDARPLSLLKEITTRERSALREALGAGGLAGPLPEGVPVQQSRNTVRPQPVGRTVPLPWPSFLADLFSASGCKVTDSRRFGAFGISYRPDGRPAGGSLDASTLPAECAPALAALARMTLADPEHLIVEGEIQMVVVPVSADFVRCVTDMTPGGSARAVVAGKIETPRKIRDVRPIFPIWAQQNRIQGIVVLEGDIAETGCVTSMEVLSSAHPALNLAAIQAVSGWRFSPTLVNGQPVPVIMTVTVNFTLK